MESQILNKNIVFIGEFKPSLFDKLYFIKKQIISEDEFLPTSLFLPDLTIIETKNYLLDINSNRFTISYKNLEDKNLPNPLNIEKALEESKVNAFGFNFKIDIFIDDKNETKKYFYFEDNRLNKFFDSENSAYGYYVSKDLENCRLRLDIKPVQLQKITENLLIDAIDFNFNFHFENSNYLKELTNFNHYQDLTLEIINHYE
jgi:hypothetical protein